MVSSILCWCKHNESVGKAAQQMVEEVRSQFREIPGIMEGTGKPDTERCVEIATAASLKRNGSSRCCCYRISNRCWIHSW